MTPAKSGSTDVWFVRKDGPRGCALGGMPDFVLALFPRRADLPMTLPRLKAYNATS